MERRQIEQELLHTHSAAEVVSVFAEAGMEISIDTAKDIAARVVLVQKENGSALSENELDAVSGGRDFGKEGCAATVEYGSDCWGEDGGCMLIHYTYVGGPIYFECKKCGKRQLYLVARAVGAKGDIYRCRSCGQEHTSWDMIR